MKKTTKENRPAITVKIQTEERLTAINNLSFAIRDCAKALADNVSVHIRNCNISNADGHSYHNRIRTSGHFPCISFCH